MTLVWKSKVCTFFRSTVLGLVCATFSGRAASIVDSPHNLSASGPGSVRATVETELCIFCHTPHNASVEAPLWNRNESGATYIPYSSTTLKASVGQPTGASKLCLSCHDGTVALGMVRSRPTPIAFLGGITSLPVGSAHLGTDLSDDHPISFTYDQALVNANGQLKDPSTLTEAVRLDANSQLQCTSCHDPHDNEFGQFLVMDNFASALCITCHDQNDWEESSHRRSPATWNGVAPDPWPHTEEVTVEANACGNCHQPHGTENQWLLNFADESENCFSCHNGHVASLDLRSEFDKRSIHNLAATTAVHDPTEDLVNPPRHVECSDCHNPHAVKFDPATAPDASGALTGVRGVDSAGVEVSTVQFEYELCYRCHADSLNQGEAFVNRQFPEINTRLEFDPSYESFHPIETVGKNSNVPSLIAPYTESSILYCTDCHNNDQGPGAGGTGPNGPHGSIYEPLLERRLELTDNQGKGDAPHALCYKCHSSTSILGDESFEQHDKHIRDVETACTTCHDSHGSAVYTHLINFNLDYVSEYKGKIEFVDLGNFRGYCTLECHGKQHDEEESYGL